MQDKTPVETNHGRHQENHRHGTLQQERGNFDAVRCVFLTDSGISHDFGRKTTKDTTTVQLWLIVTGKLLLDF